MKYLLILLLTLQVSSFSAQTIRKDVTEIVDKIAFDNRLRSRFIGVGGSESQQYINYEKLKKKATNSELLELINHENSVVKGYVSFALLERKYSNMRSIFLQLYDNKEKIETQNGCIVMDEYLLTKVYVKIDNLILNNKKDSLFYIEQINIIDSIIVNGKNEYFEFGIYNLVRSKPKLAKEYRDNKFRDYFNYIILYNCLLDSKDDKQMLSITDSLYSNDEGKKPFYFQVFTKSMDGAEGFYAEAISVSSFEFIQTNTSEFAKYFTDTTKFNASDLANWASFILGEIQIEEEGNEEKALDKLIGVLKNNSSDLELNQKEIINKLIIRLNLFHRLMNENKK